MLARRFAPGDGGRNSLCMHVAVLDEDLEPVLGARCRGTSDVESLHIRFHGLLVEPRCIRFRVRQDAQFMHQGGVMLIPDHQEHVIDLKRGGRLAVQCIERHGRFVDGCGDGAGISVDASFVDERFEFRSNPVLDPLMHFTTAVALVHLGPGSPAADRGFASSIPAADDQDAASVVLVRVPQFVPDMGE